MLRKQWREGRWREGRWRERLRWGAKRQAATCCTGYPEGVAERNIRKDISCPAQAGHWRPRPPAKAFTPSALTPAIVFSSLVLFAFGLSLPGQAQAPASPVTVSGPPDVLVIVYQQPGGADQVDITYASTVPHAQAVRDYQALTSAAAWPISTHTIKDAAAPMQSRSGPMTSIVFQALGVVQDTTHTFPIQTFAQAFRAYKRINVVFFVGPQFQFQGLRSYTDTNIRMTLDQHGTTYVYAVQILNSQMTSLPALGTLPPVPRHRSPGLILLGILGAAALAGILVYWLTARFTPKPLPQDDSVGTDSRIEVGTK